MTVNPLIPLRAKSRRADLAEEVRHLAAELLALRLQHLGGLLDVFGGGDRGRPGSPAWNRKARLGVDEPLVGIKRFQGDFRMLISILITFLVIILVLYLINLLPLDGRAKQIARVVVIILGVISLLKYIAVF
jgi:hypothetical protein